MLSTDTVAARAIPIAERERQPGEGARSDKEGEERREKTKRERGETKGERVVRRWSGRRNRAVIKIERYIDDFSDALPRNRRSPLLSLVTCREIRDRKLARPQD